ncbi:MULTISPECIES: DNA repair protein RadA [unclassified Amycolatopsis]|uniref:DNA repair protein RadA n=1 Tax=unclassified Amycolatopsis TaxID=2618356 RepID=UPI001FF3A54F|nr:MULTISPECIES: DNA repair protein RadA [unclassified Amycolatopsis]UOZ08329.1 DNA repair protein RadA [Amycolatopsis sp. WQ 127309]WSK81758.1 DNA repair protein RadA [Amycolatopsis sp. NBC_01286]
MKKGVNYRCASCGYEAAKWLGRCPECQEWGSFAERGAAGKPAIQRVAAGAPSAPARPIGEVDVETARARRTGVSELDRVLGGGLVPGAVVLLAGEPGVGKSTLLLEVAYQWAKTVDRSLYVTGEESAGQVRLRAERTGNVHDRMYLAAESDLSAILGHVDDVKPGVLIVDSVQTMASPLVDGSPGGVTQVKAVTSGLVALAKERGLPVVLVGHVTKDGTVAGPRVLEHLVDVVLQFEGDKHSTLRMVRGIKNRFGAADEIGCFELVEEGIVGVPDPSGLFISQTAEPVPGTAITVAMEGKRPLLGEVQALVSSTSAPQPRRAVSGLDSARVAMVLAVLEKRGGLKLADKDVYVATVGGMKITEPGIDLALVLALTSSFGDVALSPRLVSVGEVGLAGEIRRVPSVGRRLAEAARLGFTHALVPPDSGKPPAGIRVLEVANVADALNAASHAR